MPCFERRGLEGGAFGPLWPFSSSRGEKHGPEITRAAPFAVRVPNAAASQLHPHRTAHRRPCASATRAGINMGMPPHTKCCGCCCNLHIGTIIGTGLYLALLFILTVILPATGLGQQGVDEAKAFCDGTTAAYRKGNDINSALPSCTRRSTHPAPAPASLPGAQATTCVTAPISAPTTGTRWRWTRPRLACTAGPSASFCSCC